MFETIHEHLKKKGLCDPPQVSEVSLSKNPAFNLSVVLDKCKDIDNITEKELFDILKKSFKVLLDDIFINKNHDSLMLFFNTKFLNIFIQVIGTVVLNNTEIIYCNTIVYDYLTDQNIKKEEFVKTLFLTLGRNVNKQKVYELIALGIDEPLAIKIAVARNSTDKESVNIARINLMMICSSPDLFTSQTIINVYTTLFEYMSPLFTGVMYDVYTDDDLEAISDVAADIYSNIGLAIIDILNTVSSAIIRKTLIDYSQEYNVNENRKKVRFSIENISMSEYFRIYNVIDILKHEGVLVP